MPPESVPGTARTLIIGCGALVRELADIIERSELDAIDVECLPAILHNRPDQIPEAVEARILRAGDAYETIFVGYADCGTGGRLDAVLDDYGVQRLPGAHCYEFYSGMDRFAALHDAEIGTLYLTDYLARHFDRLIWAGLGLDRHPELRDEYFRHYTRVLYISQRPTDESLAAARAGADRLGLEFTHLHVGYGELETQIITLGESRRGAA